MLSNKSLAICAVLLFITSLLSYGYRMDGNNQAVQLALVKSLNDPSLYPNDPYAVSLGYYGSTLWPIVAWCAKFIPLQPLLFGLFCLERLLGIFAAGALARKLAPKSSLAAVAAMVLMAWPITPVIGGGTIVKRYFEQTGFSIPFFLLAAAAFHDSRKIAWAILLAIGFNLNSIYGTYAATYFGGAFLFSAAHRAAWKQWLATCVAFLALATPALLRGFALMHRSSAANNDAWMSAALVRSSHHLYPLTWGSAGFLQLGLLLGILLFFLVKNRKTEPTLVAQGAAWTLVCCCWIGVAFAAAYVIKKPSLLMLQPARATDLWVCVASILAVSLAALDLERTAGSTKIAFVFFALALVGILRLENAPYIILAWLALTMVPEVWRRFFFEGNPTRLSLILLILVCTVQLRSFWQSFGSDTSFMDAFVTRISDSVVETAEWARKNSPKDAVFLIDPSSDKWNHFRELSERSLVTSLEEGAAINWDRSFATEWIRRMRIIGYDVVNSPWTSLEDIYHNLSDDDIRRIAKQTRLNYWIVPLAHPSSFQVAFQTGEYKVLQTDRRLESAN